MTERGGWCGTRTSKFFGQWRGCDWIMPKFDGQRILRGEVHRTEMEFWFRLFATGRAAKQPDPVSDSGAGMPRMTFTDLEDFLNTAVPSPIPQPLPSLITASPPTHTQSLCAPRTFALASDAP